MFKIRRFSKINIKKPEIKFKTLSKEIHESYDSSNPNNNYKVEYNKQDSSDLDEPFEELSVKEYSDNSDVKGAITAAAVPVGAIGAYVGSKKLYDKYGSGLKKRYNDYIGVKPKLPIDHTKFKKGDVVSANRGAYKHYGVVIDDLGNVVEYGSHKFDPRTAKVLNTTLDEMSGGDPLKVEQMETKFTPDEIAERAKKAIGDSRGQYNIRNNNCEHFAREMATGNHESKLIEEFLNKESGKKIEKFVKKHVNPENINETIDNFLKKSLKNKKFSIADTFRKASGDHLSAELFRHFINHDLFNVRKKLTRDLGGLSHFNKYQSQYLSGGGAAVGAGIGSIKSDSDARKLAKKYGLKPGTAEYANFVRSRRHEGLVKGAGIGAGIGFGSSKAADAIRGKVISDKARVKYNGKLDFGKDYIRTGKAFRGITSEKDIDTIINNWKEENDYLNNLKKML